MMGGREDTSPEKRLHIQRNDIAANQLLIWQLAPVGCSAVLYAARQGSLLEAAVRKGNVLQYSEKTRAPPKA
jgi:hypothetical protein